MMGWGMKGMGMEEEGDGDGCKGKGGFESGFKRKHLSLLYNLTNH